MKKCLNVGCGEDIKKTSKKETWVNLDSLNLKGVDAVHDLNKLPWPFKENTFDKIYASHILEHVDNLIEVMKEIKRVCKNGAKVVIRVPHFSCGVSYRDPTHKRLFSYFTYDYFSTECFYDTPKFKILDRKLNFTRQSFTGLNKIFNPLININPAIYERFFCWMLPCAESLFILEAVK